MSYGRDRTIVTATIEVGQSLSAEVNVNERTLVGIQFPADAEGVAVTLQALSNDGTWDDVKDDGGAEVSITVAAGVYTAITPAKQLTGLGRIKVRTGSSAAPTVQAGAALAIGLVLV